jgi:hypothetical protein
VAVPVNRKLLAIYLQDHHAGSTVGLQLAHRTRSANQGTTYGDFLSWLADEIAADRRTLEEIMDDLDVSPDRAKVAAAWTAEKVGRLKLNGRLIGYSPLSRVVELEGLALGVTGKLAMWRALRAVADDEPELDAAQLERLADRAKDQQRQIEEQRLDATRLALVS